MSDEQNFPDEQCHASASPQAAQEGLHVAKVTDLRDFDDWTNDESFCQRFLANRPREWRTAIERYWRERCTRRELAAELGLNLESAKNLLRRIRKAARDTQNGTITIRPRHEEGVRYPGRPHCGINTADIHAICDRDEDALAHLEEYGRLNTIERLNMFSPAITGELVKVFGHSDAVGVTLNEAITSGLVAKADALKANVVRPDPFMDLPVTAIFADYCTSMRIPEVDESGVTRWKVRVIGRSETEPIKRGRPRKKPATEITEARSEKHERIDVSDLRIVPIFLNPTTMNTINGDANAA